MSVVVIADETPVARKEHQCSQCSRMIQPGEKYHRQRNIFEGEPQVYKECWQCGDLTRDLFALDYTGDDDWTFPYLPDFDYWDEVGRLGLVWGRRHFLYTRKWRWRGRLMDYPQVAA